MKAGNSLAFLYQDINELEHSRQVKLPRVTVVMPLKGFGEHNLHNWRSQVSPSCCSIIVFFSWLSFLPEKALDSNFVVNLDRFICVDYFSLWWAIGISFCCRKY